METICHSNLRNGYRGCIQGSRAGLGRTGNELLEDPKMRGYSSTPVPKIHPPGFKELIKDHFGLKFGLKVLNLGGGGVPLERGGGGAIAIL